MRRVLLTCAVMSVAMMEGAWAADPAPQPLYYH
jgi:hypothetical protein